jgi:hypothetical protein
VAYIIGITVGIVLGAAIWITFTILRRKFWSDLPDNKIDQP